MIKYLGSKRRLVPALAALAEASGARTAIDLFTGTTRVAQAFKQQGARVTAIDTARYAEVFSRCYIETDLDAVDMPSVEAELARLDRLPGREGYFTETFCQRSRFFHRRTEPASTPSATRSPQTTRAPGSSLCCSRA